MIVVAPKYEKLFIPHDNGYKCFRVEKRFFLSFFSVNTKVLIVFVLDFVMILSNLENNRNF